MKICKNLRRSHFKVLISKYLLVYSKSSEHKVDFFVLFLSYKWDQSHNRTLVAAIEPDSAKHLNI